MVERVIGWVGGWVGGLVGAWVGGWVGGRSPPPVKLEKTRLPPVAYVPKGRLTCKNIGFSRLVRINTGIFLWAGVICALRIFVWSVKNREMSELTPIQICQNRPPRSRMSELRPECPI